MPHDKILNELKSRLPNTSLFSFSKGEVKIICLRNATHENFLEEQLIRFSELISLTIREGDPPNQLLFNTKEHICIIRRLPEEMLILIASPENTNQSKINIVLSDVLNQTLL